MIKDVLSLSVMYHGRKVGTLSMGNRSCCQFEYDLAWLREGFSISPLQLPLKPEAVEQQFRRMVFNHYARNYDDHARNFSFLCRDGRWELAPAYDLTNDQTLGEHATTINFRGLPTDEDLVAVGTNTKMSRQRCLQIIDEVKTATKEL